MSLFSAAIRFARPPPFVEGFKHLGLPESMVLGPRETGLAITLV
jgi:hypothetical protein